MAVTDIILGIFGLWSFACAFAIAAIVMGSVACSKNRRENEEEEERAHCIASGGLVLAFLAIFLEAIMVALIFAGIIPFLMVTRCAVILSEWIGMHIFSS